MNKENIERLTQEITQLVYAVLSNPKNLGKTKIQIPIKRNYNVDDGFSISIEGKGDVFFTREGLKKDSPLECNFFPNNDKAYYLRSKND